MNGRLRQFDAFQALFQAASTTLSSQGCQIYNLPLSLKTQCSRGENDSALHSGHLSCCFNLGSVLPSFRHVHTLSSAEQVPRAQPRWSPPNSGAVAFRVSRTQGSFRPTSCLQLVKFKVVASGAWRLFGCDRSTFPNNWHDRWLFSKMNTMPNPYPFMMVSGLPLTASAQYTPEALSGMCTVYNALCFLYLDLPKPAFHSLSSSRRPPRCPPTYGHPSINSPERRRARKRRTPIQSP